MSRFVVGLTGGIGSGKTAVSDHFSQLGIDIIDADIIARDVVAPTSPAVAQIAHYFGEKAVMADGNIDRQYLREKVFSNPQNKQWLDNLLHPLIRETMQYQCQQAESDYVILSIPLLTENKLQFMAHRVLVVDCSENTQIARATARDGVGVEQIKSIMRSQASRSERLAIADDVIQNDNAVAYEMNDVNGVRHQRIGSAFLIAVVKIIPRSPHVLRFPAFNERRGDICLGERHRKMRNIFLVCLSLSRLNPLE